LDFCLLDELGERVEVGAVPPDGDGLAGFVRRVEERHGRASVGAAIESMNGARFVHDSLERLGWEVETADAVKVKGLAPLACKSDRIDAWVLAELSRRERVPAIWLPSFGLGQERERARWRLFLVGKRSSLKQRVHAQLLAFATPARSRTCSGCGDGSCSSGSSFPSRGGATCLRPSGSSDELDDEIAAAEQELRLLGADHRYLPLPLSVPGIAWLLGDTIAAEIGDSNRFASPKKLTSYTRLCPRAYQPGRSDRRGPLTHAGPRHPRWALIEASTHACRHELDATNTSTPRNGSASSTAPRSPRSTSPASPPRRSGTRSPVTNPSLRQAPRPHRPHRRPPTELRHRSEAPHNLILPEQAIES
jgi:transposase